MEEQIFSIEHNGSQYEVAATYRQRSAEMILLLHGLGCSKASFRDIWSRDEFTDYSILSLDLLGFGESSKPMNFSYKMEDHACVCAQVVKNVNSEKIHIKIPIADSGHFMMNDNPDEFYRRLGKFIYSG